MVRHNRNFGSRIMYVALLLMLYIELFVLFNFRLNLALLGLFFILIFFYYLFDILDFSKIYRKKNFIYSTILNFFVFMIIFFFYQKFSLVVIFIVYDILQNIFNQIFCQKIKTRMNTLIIGKGEYKEVLRKAILRAKDQYKYIGYLSDEETVKRGKFLGRIDEVKEIVKKYNVEMIIFLKSTEVKNQADIILEQKLRGVKVIDYLLFLEEFEGKIDVDKIDSFWALMTGGFDTFHSTFQKKLKRLFDVILASILFICFIPFMAVTYILVKIDVGIKYLFTDPMKIINNPAFFTQPRLGFQGKEFKIIKFRSMKVHDPNKYSKYASEHDDRITKVGNFIRKVRLDELPQVINVLRGDMSFVGPRPEWDVLGKDYEKQIKNYHLRYAVRPGITGWAQTMFTYGASLEDAKTKLEYDVYYVKNQSLLLDLIILIKTAKTVLYRKGM